MDHMKKKQQYRPPPKHRTSTQRSAVQRAPVRDFTVLLERAVARREPLFQDSGTTAFRLVNGAADGFPGFMVDRYAEVLVAHLYEGEKQQVPLEVLSRLARQAGAEAVYIKRRPKQASNVKSVQLETLAPGKPVWGREIPEIQILENGLHYRIRPGDGLSTGLFLDMREGRQTIREMSRGKTVLNCFAYACGFALAGLRGDARRVLNLDLSRRYLDWGMENLRLNGMEPDPHDFVSGDVFDWLNRFGRRKETFNIVILDPPSYSTSKGRRFSVEKDYEELLRLAVPATTSGGIILAAMNTHHISEERFLKQLRPALPLSARIRITHEPEIDFPVAVGERACLKICWIQL